MVNHFSMQAWGPYLNPQNSSGVVACVCDPLLLQRDKRLRLLSPDLCVDPHSHISALIFKS